MNKALIALAVVAAIVLGWYLFVPETIEYASVVEDEVAALETELAELEAEVAAGTLSPAAANEARARIIARIDAITEASESSRNAKLTESQRLQLQTGLTNLKNVLVRYQSTLAAVDEVAGVDTSAEASASLNRGGGGGGARSGSLAGIVSAALSDIQDSLEDMLDEIVTEEELEAMAEGSASVDDDMSTSSDDMDDDTSSDDDDTSTSSDDMSDDMDDDTSSDDDDTAASSSMSVEVDASATLEAEAGDDATDEETTN